MQVVRIGDKPEKVLQNVTGFWSSPPTQSQQVTPHTVGLILSHLEVRVMG